MLFSWSNVSFIKITSAKNLIYKKTPQYVVFNGAEIGVCALRKQQLLVVFSRQTEVPQRDLGIPCTKKEIGFPQNECFEGKEEQPIKIRCCF